MKIIFSALLCVIFNLAIVVNANGQISVPKNSPEENQEQDVDKPVKIKRKAFPRYPTNCNDPIGYVAVKVTFDKSGKITDTVVIGSVGCKDFEKSAIDAAKKIKFEPAVKNGEPVTVTKRIEYSFSSGGTNTRKSR